MLKNYFCSGQGFRSYETIKSWFGFSGALIMVVLVFPSSLEASLAYTKERKGGQKKVIGASSLEKDPFAEHYDDWVQIPFIHEEGFVPALRGIIDKFKVSSIFTPHAPSYLRLTELQDQLPDVHLEGESPYERQMNRVRDARRAAQEGLEMVRQLSSHPERISVDFLASLIDQSGRLYGECTREKIVALCAALAHAPKGDIVEIGVFFGKSAYILNRLAARFNIGNTLAVDPWVGEISFQEESSETIQKLSGVWDWELVFQGFLLQMMACTAGGFNYFRMTSLEAWDQYRQTNHVITPEFGRTDLAGTIAVLHLDGNHDESAVTEDFECWGQRVAPGGWIIFDDYDWSQGDGPRRVADRIMAEWKDRIARHFVAGGAAFIQLKE